MESLQNHFLIAMSSLKDSVFERAVVYICEHDHKGAMGFIINHPCDIPISELLQQMELYPDNCDSKLEQPVMIGGPVNPERGFVLHSPQSGWDNSSALSDDLMLTSSRDILASIGTTKAPENFIVTLGYAGWSQNQLEQELADNCWLTTPANLDIIFNLPFEDRWQQATHSLGFDVWQMSQQTGHA